MIQTVRVMAVPLPFVIRLGLGNTVLEEVAQYVPDHTGLLVLVPQPINLLDGRTKDGA